VIVFLYFVAVRGWEFQKIKCNGSEFGGFIEKYVANALHLRAYFSVNSFAHE
jgi:hypothetical protein